MHEDGYISTPAVLDMVVHAKRLGVELRLSEDENAFANWFADSQFVDEHGQPRRMFHGTNQAFDRFNGPSHFSPSAQVASEHADWRAGEDGGDPNVRPVYLSIKNPLVMADPSMLVYERGEVQRLQAQGYDGAISQDGEDVIAFSPDQVRSAIGLRLDPRVEAAHNARDALASMLKQAVPHA